MRATWIVLGAVVLGGAVTYWQLRSGSAAQGAESGSAPASAGTQPPVKLERTSPLAGIAPGAASAAAAPAPDPGEARAAELVSLLGRAREAKESDRIQTLEAQLRKEAWDAPSARRYAVEQGAALLQQGRAASGTARLSLLDRARRLLSRGVLAPDLFADDGAPLPARATLLDTIRALNTEVLTYAPGLEGVTKPYVVPPGAVPVQIVTEQKLPYGHNVLLYWNKRGNLDPKRLRAGETLLLPQDELVVHVEVARRLLVLFLGEAFVKEFRVGVGKDATPTPRGWFTVRAKQTNPDWTRPQDGRRFPAGDPGNELGSVWIHITNEQYPEHYGIHGTNKPDTVGSACSQGCVRLTDAEASEVYWWVRQATGGGAATRVFIH